MTSDTRPEPRDRLETALVTSGEPVDTARWLANKALAADPALTEALALGLAWAEATEALPAEDYALSLRGSANWFKQGPKCIADAYPSDGRRKAFNATGPNPTTALTNLADRLREKAR